MIIAAATLLLHLQCSGNIMMGTSPVPTTVEMWVSDLPDTQEKSIKFHLQYGQFFPVTQDDSITVTNDQFFVRTQNATRSGDEFITASTTSHSGLVQAVSPVDYPTFVTLAAAAQAQMEFRLPSRGANVPLTCKSVTDRR
jgi:hypothetical protein